MGNDCRIELLGYVLCLQAAIWSADSATQQAPTTIARLQPPSTCAIARSTQHTHTLVQRPIDEKLIPGEFG